MSPGQTSYTARVAQLVRKLGSPNPNEANVALKALKQTLTKAGENFNDLGNLIEQANGTNISETEMQRVYAAGVADGIRQVEDRNHGSKAFREIVATAVSRTAEMVELCVEHLEDLNDTEQGFIEGQAVIVARGSEPSERQLAWIMKIHRRLSRRYRS